MQYIRDDHKDDYKILALQDSILKIAHYIDCLCVEDGIDYFIMGGSALGALRHGGFIPWDDDLDIFMKPEDFNRFREVFDAKADKGKYYLQQLSLNDGRVASAKVRLNHTAYIENETKEMKIHQGIFVDIFILHDCPQYGISRIKQCLAAKYILAKGQGMKNISYKGIKGLLVNTLKLFPKDFGVSKALKILYKYDGKHSDYVCHFMGKAFYKKGIYEATYFAKPVRVKFEKIELNAPNNTDGYLRSRFGDYMKMPSKTSIASAQHTNNWSLLCDGNSGDQYYGDEVYLV